MSRWSHLSNAALIDWVIADFKENRSDWEAACDAAWEAACDAAWYAACDAARDAARAEAWVTGSEWYVVRDDSLCACLALIAYDHAGSLFDMPVERVEVLAYLGQPAAVLLLTACRMREKRRELNHV